MQWRSKEGLWPIRKLQRKGGAGKELLRLGSRAEKVSRKGWVRSDVAERSRVMSVNLTKAGEGLLCIGHRGKEMLERGRWRWRAAGSRTVSDVSRVGEASAGRAGNRLFL